LDAIYLKLRPDVEPAGRGVLVAWGVTLEGQKVQLGSRESYLFGRDLTERELRAPALIIADGAAGIWKATREL
jgi:transposase-like protein